MKLIVAGAIVVIAAAGCSTVDIPGIGGAATVPMNFVTEQGIGANAGAVILRDSSAGLVLDATLAGISPGQHGFHVHANASCGPGPDAQGKTIAAGAAGGHFDPQNAGIHGPPQGPGHMGDLPPLTASADGRVSQQVVAPRLRLADVRGRALMVHVGGDNHSDHPAPLGGGGGRFVCGIIR